MIESSDERNSEKERPKAVILIGHGSRAAGADDDMDRVAETLQKETGGIVAVCRMSGRGIPLVPVLEKCIREGAREIIVIPYFLHYGVHLRQDIPEMLREAVTAHPEVRLVLGRHLGYDESLVSLVGKRIRESETLCDIRDLPEAPIDRSPREIEKMGGVLLFFAALTLIPEPALAMHISEGILPASWAALWYVIAIPFIAWGLRDLRLRSAELPYFKPMVGLVGAAVFLISCMPIPIPSAGTCSHPAGTGLAAILIGPGLTVVIASIALTLQALFLAHGGLTTLGANIVAMGVAGAYVGYGAYRLGRILGLPWMAAAFLAGIFSDWATYAMTSFELAAALHGEAPFSTMFTLILVAFIPTQIPLGILEGFLCAGALRFIRNRKPELLRRASAGGIA
jgi:cobalt/nickel transport system permease protein